MLASRRHRDHEPSKKWGFARGSRGTHHSSNARDFIEAHADQAPSVQDVYRAAGVSRRTLNYAFRELIGVTPKQYLRATRLDGVRKELHRKGPSAKIADTANTWGYWHLGQFAADYRRQFGELPSDTLRRSGTA